MMKYPEIVDVDEDDNPFAYIQVEGRLKTDLFKSLFIEFLEDCVKKPTLIIGDSEKAFWSQNVMRPFYAQNNIEIQPINVSQEGHIRLAVLDRLVRTIRDMCDNLKIDSENITIPTLQEVITTYNNTKHKDLQNHTPREVYLDELLENRILKGRRTENWLKSNNEGFLIPEGSDVLIRRKYSKFEKRRGTTTRDGEFEVVRRVSGTMYEVKNKETGETEIVARRDLKRA